MAAMRMTSLEAVPNVGTRIVMADAHEMPSTRAVRFASADECLFRRSRPTIPGQVVRVER